MLVLCILQELKPRVELQNQYLPYFGTQLATIDLLTYWYANDLLTIRGCKYHGNHWQILLHNNTDHETYRILQEVVPLSQQVIW